MRSSESRLVVGLVAVVAAFGMACGKSQRSIQGADARPATVKSPTQAANADDLVEDNFRMGPDLPKGWPTQLIPVPPGASPVASLSETSLPGSPGPATAVLYSAPQSAATIQEFFVRELPKKGWTVLQSSPPGESMVTAAQGNGYLGIFSSGTGIRAPAAMGTEEVTMQVVLAEIAG